MNISPTTVINTLIIIIAGLVYLYIRTRITERAKQEELKKANSVLIEETEKIKRKHELDFTLRKVQYESKKDEYLKFFRLLDELTKGDNNIQVCMIPILEEFNRNYITGKTQKSQKLALNVLTSKTQSLMMDANKDLIRLRQETNTIKLTASDDVIDKLDLLELAHSRAFEKSCDVVKNLPLIIMSNDTEGQQEQEIALKAHGNIINMYTDALRKSMRDDLNRI